MFPVTPSDECHCIWIFTCRTCSWRVKTFSLQKVCEQCLGMERDLTGTFWSWVRPAVGEKWQNHIKSRLTGAPRVYKMMPQVQVRGAAGDGSSPDRSGIGWKMPRAPKCHAGRIRSNEKVVWSASRLHQGTVCIVSFRRSWKNCWKKKAGSDLYGWCILMMWVGADKEKLQAFLHCQYMLGFTGWMYLPYPQVCHLPVQLLELTQCFMKLQKSVSCFISSWDRTLLVLICR